MRQLLIQFLDNEDNQNLVISTAEDDDNSGICIGCLSVHENVEPDAESYPCDKCGNHSVYGAEGLLLRI